MVVWEMGGIVAVGRIVPWPCRGVHGPGEAGWFCLSSSKACLLNGLNNFRRLTLFAGAESDAVVLFDWDLRSVRKSRCFWRKLRLLPRGALV